MAILICCADLDLTRRWLEGIGALDAVHCIQSALDIDVSREASAASLALIDLDAPGLDGVGAAAALCRGFPEISFVFFSRRPDAAEGLSLISVGGRGYCNRYIAPELLHKAVEVVALGEVWLGRRLVDHLLQNLGRPLVPEADAGTTKGGARLTEREREVALLVGKGASNKRVARQLAITERTVKAHMSAIFRKTNTRDRLQLGLLINSWQADAVPLKPTGTKVQ